MYVLIRNREGVLVELRKPGRSLRRASSPVHEQLILTLWKTSMPTRRLACLCRELVTELQYKKVTHRLQTKDWRHCQGM